MKRLDCAGLMDVAPELAAGTLCGEERAAAVAHLARCPSCQHEVNTLATVTDRLLLLAPAEEPPVGFEQRVFAALDGATTAAAARNRRRTRTGRNLVAIAALVLAFVTGGLLLDAALPSDSVDARAEMRTDDGDVVGHAYLHDDEPTLLVVTLPGWSDEAKEYGAVGGRYTLHVAVGDGREKTYPVASATEPIWSATLQVPAERVRSVWIVDDRGRVWCRAEFE
jgi:hypothetical protein